MHAEGKRLIWHCHYPAFTGKLAMAGVDLPTVEEMSGHKSLQMALRYARLAHCWRGTAVNQPGLCNPEPEPDTASADFGRAAGL